jgi:hypothetical protein
VEGTQWVLTSVDTDISKVYGNSFDDAYAFGFDGALWHLNEGLWTKQVISSNVLFADISEANGLVVAVGSGSTIFMGQDGNFNRAQGTDCAIVNTLWGSSPENMYAGCSFGVAHYDGSTWKDIAMPDQIRGVTNFYGRSADDIYAIGDSHSLLHYNGSNWVNCGGTPQGTLLTGIWAAGPSDVYVVGNVQYAIGDTDGSVWHFDGQNWTPIQYNLEGLDAIYGRSGSDIFVAGARGVMSHFDGNSWTSEYIADQQYAISSITSAGPNDLIAVGEAGLTLHWPCK